MHITVDKLKSIVVGSGIVNDEDFQSAREEAERANRSIVNVLIGRGDVLEDYMAELLQQYFNVPLVNLKSVSIPTETLELIPEAFAKTKNIVIFEYDKESKTARAAMADPFDYETIEFVRAKLGAWGEPRLSTSASLKFGLKQYKKKIGEEFNKVIAENIQKSLATSGETNLSKMAQQIPIVVILDSIVEHAVAMGASDIHFEPLEEDFLVRYRIDGIMNEILSLPKVIAPILVARVKILTNMQIDEHSKPQDGRFRFEMEDQNIDLRVNVMPIFHGEKVEMRILKGSARPLALEDLGLSDEGVKAVGEEIQKPHGMILVTGPTGHGKTTTLYAILHILNTPKVNITTIEDPIEYEVSRINQTQVNVKAGITFANGLRSLLRQNPDIIMIGEIRDNETVDIAIHAALTGHLVLSSLHTNDAPSALPRLLDMGAAPFLISSTINLIIAQRLVRRICKFCVISYPMAAEVKRLIEAQIALTAGGRTVNAPATLYKGRGCNVCGNSGYHGQIGIFETMKVSEAIRQLLLKLVPVEEIRRQAIKEGMTTMFEDGLQKVEKGITTIEEVLRVVRE